MYRLFKFVLGLALLLAPSLAYAQTQRKPALAALDALQPSPSLWHIKGPQGEVYLLGSVHVLPPNLNWRTPAISHAISRSDVFVFEVPQDKTAIAELQSLVQDKGFLAPNERLRGLLDAKSLPDYDQAVAASGLQPDMINRERPWLAGLQLMFAGMAKL